MQAHKARIEKKIEQVCGQWKRVILIKGGAQFLITICVGFLLALLADVFGPLQTEIRIALLAIIVLSGAVILFMNVIRPLSNLPDGPQLARYLEEKYPHLEDRLVTAIEVGDGNSPNVSKLIVDKLVEDTRFYVEPINVAHSLKSKSANAWGISVLALVLLLAALMLGNRQLFQLHAGRLIAPWDFPTIKAQPRFVVEPGDLRVQKGTPQQLRAQFHNMEPDQVTLYYSEDDSLWEKAAMEPSNDEGLFTYDFFNVQADLKYYVKADEKISAIYKLTVYDAPSIRRIDLTYYYPKYTGLEPLTETDGGDVWAPEGTVVTIRAIADKRLTSATLVIGGDKELSATVSADSVVTARLTVTEDTNYELRVIGRDALTNDPAPEYYIHALPDQPPVLTLDKPGRDIRATILEEVSVRIKVEDDYGIPETVLKYAFNGSEERQIVLNLQRKSRKSTGVSRQSFSCSHLFYLEELSLKPGDFLSYYVQAANSSGKGEKTTSDIYFVEIRPFETEFTRPLSQGAGGGSGGIGGKLSQTQKEIIVATWKTRQKMANLDGDRLSSNIGVLIESQSNLREVTQGTLFQLKQRSVFTRDVNAEVTKFYTQAVEAMQHAIVELSNENLDDAQVPQREALQSLLQAEAQIREVQIQRSRGQGGSQQASLSELAELFDEEMDKLNNKYETLNQAHQNQTEEQLSDALQKVKELAKRQQEFNRQMRDLARNELQDEEKKRKIEELRREQERIRRETQELARQMEQMNQQNTSLPREIQENLRRASSEMNNASHNLKKDNTELAAAKGTRALNRLNQLEDALRRNQQESLRRQVAELEKNMERLVDSQKELSKDVTELAKQAKSSEANAEDLADAQSRQKDQLEDIQRMQERIESLNKQSRLEHTELSRQVSETSREIADDKLDQKMQEANRLLSEEHLDAAARANREILSRLEESRKQLTKMRGALAETEEEKLDLALNQTQRIREQLESLQREALEKSGLQTAQDPSSERTQAGPGESKSPLQRLASPPEEWMNEELAKNLKDLEHLENSLPKDHDTRQSAIGLNKNLNGILQSFRGGLPERMRLIEERVLGPLRDLEAELAQQLELLRNKEKLFLARDEKIPKEYEELVEKYYEALSKTGR